MEGVKGEMDQILGTDLLLTPRQFLFYLILEDRYSRDQKYLLHILSMIAMKIVKIKLRNSQPPTVAQWKQKLREVNRGFNCSITIMVLYFQKGVGYPLQHIFLTKGIYI